MNREAATLALWHLQRPAVPGQKPHFSQVDADNVFPNTFFDHVLRSLKPKSEIWSPVEDIGG